MVRVAFVVGVQCYTNASIIKGAIKCLVHASLILVQQSEAGKMGVHCDVSKANHTATPVWIGLTYPIETLGISLLWGSCGAGLHLWTIFGFPSSGVHVRSSLSDCRW